MYRHILIPTDGSELASKAVTHGIALAQKIGAQVTILNVILPFHVLTTDTQMVEDTASQYKSRMRVLSEKTLAAASYAAKAADVPCEISAVEFDRPYQVIIETANTKSCDLIVMASHGRSGMSAMLLGSETAKVLTHCKIPVLVHR